MSESPPSEHEAANGEETRLDHVGDEEKPKKLTDQITFQFCGHCSNMLYPKEDRLNRDLLFTCRTCNWHEPSRTTCVFRNVLNGSVGETAGVTQDVGLDPTVGLPDLCTLCGQEIACRRCGRCLSGVEVWREEEEEQDKDNDNDRDDRADRDDDDKSEEDERRECDRQPDAIEYRRRS
ncbi:MAG: hypothetical protein M1826_005064 [Phylliscum demangeonii]|nr:MAG: hypothetical protein M1826_005064 [Phylliscum demangeonii]